MYFSSPLVLVYMEHPYRSRDRTWEWHYAPLYLRELGAVGGAGRRRLALQLRHLYEAILSFLLNLFI
jgi:hypothetical protein